MAQHNAKRERNRDAARSSHAQAASAAQASQPLHAPLLEVEEKYRILVETTGTGYVIVDREGRVLDANAEYVRLSGHESLDEILGRCVTEWTADYDRVRNATEVRKCMETGHVRRLEVDYRGPQGVLIPVEISATVVNTGGVPIIAAICRDITERRRDEHLVTTQRDLALALNGAHELATGLRICLNTALRVSSMDCGGMYLLDQASGALVMAVHEGLSAPFVNEVERCPAESARTTLVMRGVPVYEMYERMEENPSDVQRNEGLRVIAVIPIRREGRVIGCMNVASHSMETVPLYARSALETIAAQTSNAIVRLQATEELREERGLFVAGPVIVVKWLFEAHRPIVYVSPNFTTQFGHTTEDFIAGRLSVHGLVHPDDVPRLEKELKELQATGRDQHGYAQEYRLRCANGDYRWVRDFTVINRDSSGAASSFYGYIQDITEQKRADEERRKIETQMLHAQKLESLGVLAGGIAHDFNNILMAILGNIDLALAELPPVSPVHRNLVEAELASRRAADLCKHMLAYSGKGRVQLRPLNLNDALGEIRRMLEISLSRKTVLTFDLAHNLPAIEADPTQLHQILMNLVINASEAIGERSGIIAVSTGMLACDRAYLRETWLDEQLTEGPYVFVEVADNGCGMDAGTRARVFDPFFTTKFTGRGLGLAAVLGIVRSHHGTIKLWSEPGRGTTFRVLFPASPRQIQSNGGRDDRDKAWLGSGTILLVDDEETVRAIGQRMLELLGFSVLTASSGADAVEVLSQHKDSVSGCILDLTMPRMDGEDTFRLLRGVKPDLRAMLASGYSEEELAQKFGGTGFASFIQKPYTKATLTAKLREMLA